MPRMTLLETMLYDEALSGKSYSAAVLADSPLAFWAMNASSGTAETDLSGNGKTLTYSGTGVTLGVSGPIPGYTAAQFDGISGFASRALDLSALNAVTLEFWLKQASFGSGDELAAEFTANAGGSTGGFFVDPNAAASKMMLYMLGDVGAPTCTYSRPSAGAYHHYAAIFNKGAATNEIALYLDGAVATPTVVDNNNNTNNFANSTLYLMSRAGSFLFNAGHLAMVAVYGSALSGARIAAHYAAGT